MKPRARIVIFALAAFAAGFAGARLGFSPGTPSPEALQSPASPAAALKLSQARARRLAGAHKTLGSAAREPDPVQRHLSVLSFLSRAHIKDLPALYARHYMDPELAPLVATTWARLDPEGMFAYLRDHDPRSAPGMQPMRILFENWVRTDPDSALAAIEDSTLPRVRRRLARGEYVNSLLSVDPDKAFAYLASLPVPELPLGTDWRTNPWVAENPAHAVERVTALPESEFRDAALEQIATLWFDRDPAAAATWLATTTAQNDWEPTSAILNRWVEGDPAGAAEYVAANIVGEQRVKSVKLVAARWAEDDPQAALDWVAEHIWGNARHQALGAIAFQTTKLDPQTALALLDQIPNARTRDMALEKIAQQWQRQDSEAALEWAQHLPDARDREGALVAVARSWSNASARKAGAYALEVLADAPDSVPLGFTQAVTKSWVDRFPAESLNWISKLPPEHAGPAFETAIDAWAKTSRAPVTKKVLYQSLPEQRDLALHALFNSYLKYDGLEGTRAFVAGVEIDADREKLSRLLVEHERASAGDSSGAP